MTATKKNADSSQGATKKSTKKPTKKKATAFPSEKKLFTSLTDSAFEFLETAIDGLAASPKFSTVHFAIAIELFLKARLMREHWSLLLDKPDQADKAAFFRGEAKTASPDQVIDRLKRIAVVQVPPSSIEIFKKISQHRNKMVHFVHLGETNSDGREQIVSEQMEGWMALRTLLEEWKDFGTRRADIVHINHKMEGHRAFLAKKFEAKQTELQAHVATGMHVSPCPSCGYQSLKVGAATVAIADAACAVCSFKGHEIGLTCQGCGTKIRCSDYNGRPENCPHCKAPISRDQVEKALNTGEVINHKNYFDNTTINCPGCMSLGNVVENGSLFICTDCFAIDGKYEVCEYCSDGQLGGVPEHSYLVGCEFCDGSYRDD